MKRNPQAGDIVQIKHGDDLLIVSVDDDLPNFVFVTVPFDVGTIGGAEHTTWQLRSPITTPLYGCTPASLVEIQWVGTAKFKEKDAVYTITKSSV